MTDIPVDKKVYRDCKIHPTIMARILEELKKDPARHDPKHRGRKWQEIPVCDGVRYEVNFRHEGDLDVVIGMRKTKYQPRNRK